MITYPYQIIKAFIRMINIEKEKTTNKKPAQLLEQKVIMCPIIKKKKAKIMISDQMDLT